MPAATLAEIPEIALVWWDVCLQSVLSDYPQYRFDGFWFFPLTKGGVFSGIFAKIDHEFYDEFYVDWDGTSWVISSD